MPRTRNRSSGLARVGECGGRHLFEIAFTFQRFVLSVSRSARRVDLSVERGEVAARRGHNARTSHAHPSRHRALARSRHSYERHPGSACFRQAAGDPRGRRLHARLAGGPARASRSSARTAARSSPSTATRIRGLSATARLATPPEGASWDSLHTEKTLSAAFTATNTPDVRTPDL